MTSYHGTVNSRLAQLAWFWARQCTQKQGTNEHCSSLTSGLLSPGPARKQYIVLEPWMACHSRTRADIFGYLSLCGSCPLDRARQWYSPLQPHVPSWAWPTDGIAMFDVVHSMQRW